MEELKKTKIFCIIPAFNEEKNIIKVVNDVLPLVDEVVVVDDASTDQTSALLEKLQAENQIGKLTILKHTINRHQGASLQTGNEYAISKGAEIIVHFDADGQFLASEIKDLTEPIEKGEADVVLGSRFLEKKSQIPHFKKYIIFPLARLVNRILMGVNLSDPQSGFRALSRSSAEKITIKQDRSAHCSEILSKIFEYNLRVREVPITVIYEDFGQRFSGGIRIIKDLLLGKIID